MMCANVAYLKVQSSDACIPPDHEKHATEGVSVDGVLYGRVSETDESSELIGC